MPRQTAKMSPYPSSLANHLWQSTLCIAAAWALNLTLRTNRAAVRYWVCPAHYGPGVTGSDLKKQVQAILTGGVGRELDIRKKTALTAVGMAALIAPVVIGMTSARVVHGQPRPLVPRESVPYGALMAPQILLQSKAMSTLQFEIASVKIASPSAQQHGRLTRMEALIETSPGLLNARNVTLRQLIEGAYLLETYQVIGGPQWIDSVPFEVQGKPAGAASRQQLLLMLQPLLTERFRLAFHRDTKELPVYALVVVKGAKLKRYQGAEGASLGVNRLGRNVTMSDFAEYLTHLGNDLPVIDKTGLTGNYDLDLDMEKIVAAAASDAGGTAPSVGSIFQATANAIEELGLKLVRTKAPVEVLVVNHAERPSQN